jgi:hypothetical protein
MSPQRIDYYDSPEVPRVNSLVPAVTVVVVSDAGEILLIRRTSTVPRRHDRQGRVSRPSRGPRDPR